jgi:hypothetical protein
VQAECASSGIAIGVSGLAEGLEVTPVPDDLRRVVEDAPLIEADTRADCGVVDAEVAQYSALNRALHPQGTTEREAIVHRLHHSRPGAERLEGEPEVGPLDVQVHDVGLDGAEQSGKRREQSRRRGRQPVDAVPGIFERAGVRADDISNRHDLALDTMLGPQVRGHTHHDLAPRVPELVEHV